MSTPMRTRTKKITGNKRKNESSPTPSKKRKIEDSEDSKKEEEILSILKPELRKKIENNANLKVLHDQMDKEISLKLKYNQLEKTLNMIRDLFRQKKRTAMYKDDLIVEILKLHETKKTKEEINDQIDLILKFLPDWCSVKDAPSSGRFIFQIKDYKLQNIKEKIKNNLKYLAPKIENGKLFLR
jgi:hypothetical protein